MKKVFNLVAAVLVTCSFLFSGNVFAGVAGSYLDQTFENTGMPLAYMTVGLQETHGRVQTFKPTANKIVSVDVYLKNMVPNKKLKLEIRKESDGTVVAPWTESVPFIGQMPTGWITVAYTSPFVTVTPETEYGLYLAIDGDSQAQWGYSSADPYPRGGAKGFAGDDFLFRVYGVKDADAGQNTQVAAPTVNESIKVPVLVSIEKNDVKTLAPITKEVTVSPKEKLVVNGTSFKGAKVEIYLDDKLLTTTVDADGNWATTVEGSKYKVGEHTISGTAKSNDLQVSEKAELLKIKVLGAKTTSAETSKKSMFAGWNIYYTLIPVGLLLLLLLLFALMARRHHKEKNSDKVKKEEDKKAETEEKKE